MSSGWESESFMKVQQSETYRVELRQIINCIETPPPSIVSALQLPLLCSAPLMWISWDTGLQMWCKIHYWWPLTHRSYKQKASVLNESCCFVDCCLNAAGPDDGSLCENDEKRADFSVSCSVLILSIIILLMAAPPHSTGREDRGGADDAVRDFLRIWTLVWRLKHPLTTFINLLLLFYVSFFFASDFKEIDWLLWSD